MLKGFLLVVLGVPLTALVLAGTCASNYTKEQAQREAAAAAVTATALRNLTPDQVQGRLDALWAAENWPEVIAVLDARPRESWTEAQQSAYTVARVNLVQRYTAQVDAALANVTIISGNIQTLSRRAIPDRAALFVQVKDLEDAIRAARLPAAPKGLERAGELYSLSLSLRKDAASDLADYLNKGDLEKLRSGMRNSEDANQRAAAAVAALVSYTQ